MTPTQSVLHERSQRFHAEIARRSDAHVKSDRHARFIGLNPEPHYAGMWFYNLVTYADKPLDVRIEDIQRAVCKFYKISRHDMLSDRRTKNLAFPRQIAMYLSKKLTLRSLPAIGRRFNRWDHTTVLHAVRKIEALQEIDVDTRAQISVLRSELLA